MKNRLQTWYTIVNPAAANGKALKKWKRIEQVLIQQDIPCHIVYTQKSTHAIELAKEGIEQGYRKIIAVGGDGTNNEVINGIMQQETISTTDILYALLPIGTGNDWIRTHKIPKKRRAWIKMLQAEHYRFQDMGLARYHQEGQAEERYFANVGGMAYDGFIGKILTRKQGATSNKLLYLYLSLSCLFKYEKTRARVRFDEHVVEDYFYLINAGICRYSGGGMRLVPHAVADDGQLAITIAKNMSKFDVIKSMHLLYNGKIGKHPLIDTYFTKKITVEALNDRPTFLEVDGEFLGETPVEISIVEKALRVVVPKS